MGYVLLGVLIVELLIFYRFNGKNVVSPSFVGCAMFILTTVVYLSAQEYFGYEIHSITVTVIVSLLFCVFIGEQFANKLAVKERDRTVGIDIEKTKEAIEISHLYCLIITVFEIVIMAIHFREVYSYSLLVGNVEGNFLTMAKYVREAVSNGYAPLDLSIITSQGVVISECLVWFFIYSICYNKNQTNKLYRRYLIPIIAYLPNVWITDNRVTLLRMVAVSFIIIFVFTKQKHGWTKKGNKKIVVLAIVGVCLYLVIFRLLGYRTETSLRNELWDNFTEYVSASLVGLDRYLLNGETPNTLFGETTLSSIYNILRQWGLPIPVVDSFEPFYEYAHGNSNVYTALKAYIHDYTLLGAIVAMILWGFVINYSLKYIRKNGTGFIRVCFVGMMFYPVAMISIADTTSSFLAMRTVYTLVYLLILNKLFLSNKKI